MFASDTMNTPVPANTPERLTWDEICQRYPGEWVVLVKFEQPDPDDLAFDAAVALSHHMTRKAASPDVKAVLEHGQEAGSFFTGRLIPPCPPCTRSWCREDHALQTRDRSHYRGRPRLEATVSPGRPLKLVVDTGAPETVITPEILDELGFRPRNQAANATNLAKSISLRPTQRSLTQYIYYYTLTLGTV